jgi:hypothetical protein
MPESPIELTPEQRQEYDRQKVKSFYKDYHEICIKHKMVLKCALAMSPNGIIPVEQPLIVGEDIVNKLKEELDELNKS